MNSPFGHSERIMREEARELDNAPSEYFIFLEKRDLLASIGEEASARESRNGNNYYDAFKAMLLCLGYLEYKLIFRGCLAAA
jgi:hypothetical protein